MLFVNILLLNLLIAMFRCVCVSIIVRSVFEMSCDFSKRYQEVCDETVQIWHFQSYLFIQEQFNRAPLVPPISTIISVIRFAKAVFNVMQRHRTNGQLLSEYYFSNYSLNFNQVNLISLVYARNCSDR